VDRDIEYLSHEICRGADKSLAFPIFSFAAQPKEFCLDELKKLKQQVISVSSIP
jgi:hypothetical protein